MVTTESKKEHNKVDIWGFLGYIAAGTFATLISLGWLFAVILYCVLSISGPPALLLWITLVFCCIIATIFATNEKLGEAVNDSEKVSYIYWAISIICILVGISMPLFVNTAEIISKETETEVIAPDIKYETKSYLLPGETETAKGENGEKEVTYIIIKRLINDEVISKKRGDETITKQPKNTIIYKGESTRTYNYYEEDTETGGGAICNDGWRSYSTGRGTCSRHGGVRTWL